jgi:hypothetical protein
VFPPFRRKNVKSTGRDWQQLQGSHYIPHCGLCTTPAKQTSNSSKPNACNRCYQAYLEILSLHFVQGFRMCLLQLVVLDRLDQTLRQLPDKTWRHWWCGVDVGVLYITAQLETPREGYDEYNNKSSLSCETKVYRTSRRKNQTSEGRCLLALQQPRTMAPGNLSKV